MFGVDTRRVREDLLRGEDEDIRRRRLIIGASLIGAASITAVSLLQTGIVKHLPDPPLRCFDADRVATSKEAYVLGTPDGPVAAASYMANLPIASFGPSDRAERMPWIPVIASLKALADVLVAVYALSVMIRKGRIRCIYCLTAGLSSLTVFALTIPEAGKAFRRLPGPR